MYELLIIMFHKAALGGQKPWILRRRSRALVLGTVVKRSPRAALSPCWTSRLRSYRSVKYMPAMVKGCQQQAIVTIRTLVGKPSAARNPALLSPSQPLSPRRRSASSPLLSRRCLLHKTRPLALFREDQRPPRQCHERDRAPLRSPLPGERLPENMTALSVNDARSRAERAVVAIPDARDTAARLRRRFRCREWPAPPLHS